jgi:beta-mannanase
MNRRTTNSRAARLGLTASAVLAVAACGVSNGATLSTFHAPAHAKAAAINKAALLHPKRKYYGVFTPSAPANMTSLIDSPDSVEQQTGKRPNLDLYFQSWSAGSKTGVTNFSQKTAENACAAGMLPLYTWESWDTKDIGDNVHNGTTIHNTVKWAQPAFSPSKIAAGDFDPFIRATAKLMAGLPCPIALRFDQEVNGYWYPWGEGTTGMDSTPESQAADYIKMWRHVWRIFKSENATNVLWVWSPNFQSLKHTGYPSLTAGYPGDKFVDWVGIDGYYYNKPDQTFKGLFGPTIKQLQETAPNKPWLIAETGVGSYPDASTKADQITNLLHAVANNDDFNGLVYFDQFKPNDRSDWRLDETPASLAAFSDGIASSRYAAGKPGEFSSLGRHR